MKGQARSSWSQLWDLFLRKERFLWSLPRSGCIHEPRVAAPRGAPWVIVPPCIRYAEGVSQGRWPPEIVVVLCKTPSGYRNAARRLPRVRRAPLKQRPPATLGC